MKPGDYVGFVESDGKIGCPIERVASVSEHGITLSIGNMGATRPYSFSEGIWGKVQGAVLSEAMDCGCHRCITPLFELALSSE